MPPKNEVRYCRIMTQLVAWETVTGINDLYRIATCFTGDSDLRHNVAVHSRQTVHHDDHLLYSLSCWRVSHIAMMFCGGTFGWMM